MVAKTRQQQQHIGQLLPPLAMTLTKALEECWLDHEFPIVRLLLLALLLLLLYLSLLMLEALHRLSVSH